MQRMTTVPGSRHTDALTNSHTHPSWQTRQPGVPAIIHFHNQAKRIKGSLFLTWSGWIQLGALHIDTHRPCQAYQYLYRSFMTPMLHFIAHSAVNHVMARAKALSLPSLIQGLKHAHVAQMFYENWAYQNQCWYLRHTQ